METIIHPEHLSMLTEVLARYCRTAHIEPGTLQYELAGQRIIALFKNGVHTEDAILANLDGDGPAIPRPSLTEPYARSRLVSSAGTVWVDDAPG